MRILTANGIMEIRDLTMSIHFDKPEDKFPDIIILSTKDTTLILD